MGIRSVTSCESCLSDGSLIREAGHPRSTAFSSLSLRRTLPQTQDPGHRTSTTHTDTYHGQYCTLGGESMCMRCRMWHLI